MSRKCFWVISSGCLVSAMLALKADVVHAQTPGQIPVFEQPGTGSCNAANLSNCVDSIITQAGNTITIGTMTPDPVKLHVVQRGLFNPSPAGYFLNAGRGLDVVSTGGPGEGDVAIWGRSTNAQGVIGQTSNPFAVGVLARSAAASTDNLGLTVLGTSEFRGRVAVPFFGVGGTVVMCLNVSTAQLAFCSSSLRYKTDVRPFSAGLEIVNRLHPIAFTWKQSGMRDIGLAAEDVEQVEPLLTFRNDKGEVEGVKYNQLSTIFVNAFAEQQAQIQRREEQITRQLHDLAALKVLLCPSHADDDVCR